ncbi:MAG: hypothetical protein ACTHOF_10610 [Flavisolibacter sp.]
MSISIDKNFRQSLIFFSLVAMLIGLFASRVLLSASMLFFLAFCIVHKAFWQHLKCFFNDRLLVGITLLFFIPFISGLWSDNKNEWLDLVRIKLPLLFFPVAFAGSWQLSKKQWLQLALVFLLLVLLGAVWSLWQYLQNTQAIQEAYLKAKTLPTPLENDHVRFSWLVCIAAIVCVYLIEKIKLKTIRLLLACLSFFFAAYLHILSARTGLFSLYIFGGLFVLRWLLSKKNQQPAFVVLFLILLMPLIAWFFFPTFQNRIRYIVYDFSYIKKDAYLQGANDGNRILSLKAGCNILQKHPFGVGVGDVFTETKKWYEIHVPQMIETDKIYPASEWLIYGDAAGWTGFFLFTLVMLLPVFERKKKNAFYWLSVNAVAAFSFLFDIGLEVQFGVFIYLFVILCWWKQAQKEANVV